MANTLGVLNPLRYRGYVYDQETELYYLQSRYYDPEIGRFISADAFVATGQGLLGNNMFAYCGNNPVNNIDPHGTCYYGADGKWYHDNWEYLGGYVRKPDPKAIDITDELNKAMVDHAIELAEMAQTYSPIGAALFFAEESKPHGDWDIKSKEGWNLESGQAYRYKNLLLREDDIGNIHYGYVGRVLFNLDTLLLAAGVVQILSPESSTKISYIDAYFDEPRDQWAIRVGSCLWDVGG